MKSFLTACFLILAAPVAADFPALFDVHGVAADDVLNVRTEPSAQSEIVGTLAPDDKSIEVLRHSENGRWALINFGEGSAWVAARFLEHNSQVVLMPQPMRCFGTEPFWDLKITRTGHSTTAEFSHAGEVEQSFTIRRASGCSGRSVVMAGPPESGNIELLAAVNRRYCSDGMSDREFGLGVELFILDQGNWQNYTGCCSLAP